MERKFTDDEIVKALKCCAPKGNCDECPLNESRFEGELDCVDIITQSALDLINRQKAEFERLTINMNAFGLGMKREKERADNAIKEFADKLCDGRVSNDPVVIAAKSLRAEMERD